jgi:hypothetical protein
MSKQEWCEFQNSSRIAKFSQIELDIMWQAKCDMEVMRNLAPMVIQDIHPYESPITGNAINSRKQRDEDLKRSGSRPYEGREAETREANRRKEYDQVKIDANVHDTVSRSYYALPEKVRRQLER